MRFFLTARQKKTFSRVGMDSTTVVVTVPLRNICPSENKSQTE